MKQYNKLVRDKIPEILKKDKVKYKTHTANKKEYLEKLYEKLIEEFEEFKAKPSVDEFADLLEVLEYIGKVHNFDLEDVKLTFTPEALQKIADLALARNTGARGLRAVMENVLLDIMFELPSKKNIAECIITPEVIEGNSQPKFVEKTLRRKKA